MSKIITGAFDEAEDSYENAAYSHRVPAVYWQARTLGGRFIGYRVEREGKGGHLMLLLRPGTTGVFDVVYQGLGVVGILGYSHSSGSNVVEVFGRLDFASRDGIRQPGWLLHESAAWQDVVGEAGLYWLS